MKLLMGLLPDGEPFGFMTREGFNLFIEDTNEDYEIVPCNTTTPNQKESDHVKHERS